MIYDQHVDLFTKDIYDLKILSARALGREMQLILQKSELLRLRVIGILKERNEEIQRKFFGILIDEGIPGLPDYYSAIIQAILTGTEEYRQ
ncbi:hypothetical protein [Pseudobacter ginsenosidimutans]|uniref:hypothetical protein n=1 Tax=Pseudobacter ginsenosidimutans TaxID=661488 RepID=UPI00102DC7E8|nr:hypothetical protein [Pseudobacter ginsenosidimutans]QEC40788.1 hypothetical protein FSB84_03420 [Pseudobacter ginsenosidimutans]